MKNEIKYVGPIGLISITFSALMVLLIRKHALNTLYSISETCMEIVKFYYIDFTNIYSIVVITITFLLTTIALTKILTSIQKNRRIRKELEHNKINILPSKLKSALDKANLHPKQIVLLCREEHIALTTGIVNPKIVISDSIINTLSIKELETVLLHEKYHLENQHTAFSLIGNIIKKTLFFIPTIRELVTSYIKDMEARADRFVINSQGTPRYLLSASNKITHSKFSFYPNFSNSKTERIKRLDEKTGISKKNVLYSSIVFVGMLFLLTQESEATGSTHSTIFKKYNCIGDECVQRCIDETNNHTTIMHDFSMSPMQSLPMSQNR